ncbi:hypothetical protein [Bacillus wiedmannii]|uniref:hypothetical protein n=1 Tax=Bacillus wiedmannii TaxID=1890302 RepID=UPI00027AA617|nr:hypothetical protein [Bacillus wiedmannii]EJS68539.1 hypothetical protein ICW_03096 [Bacillus wiedmannii]PEM28964.1 hypothetical protein CN617_11525 [Bacillus wiedmannii]
MNTQAAIEAAKIAADTAARNALITTIVAVITLLITSGISIWSVMRNSKITKELGEKNLKSAEQNRYIDAISQERVKWINTMRDKFSEYVKVAHIQMNDMSKWKRGKGDVGEGIMRERFHELTYIGNNIYFLLNPTEIVSKEIRKLQRTINRQLRRGNISNFDSNLVRESARDLGYLFQVVLKSEWKRVKEENKKGEEIDDEEMEQIYKKVAQKINNTKYNKYFNK